MPTYEYECESCGTITDLKHAFREKPPTDTCPNCGAVPLKRVFRPAGIVFKGSGYYVTDSRSKSGGSSDSPPSASAKAAAPAKDGAASEGSGSAKDVASTPKDSASPKPSGTGDAAA